MVYLTDVNEKKEHIQETILANSDREKRYLATAESFNCKDTAAKTQMAFYDSNVTFS